jgi:WXXGXW repeat (2 copies)
MRKTFLSTGVLAVALAASSAFAAPVYIHVRPPRIRIERHRPARPSPNHVWIGGHYRYEGRHYVWEPGHWEAGPRSGAVWVSGHWRHSRHGWYWVDGHWR